MDGIYQGRVRFSVAPQKNKNKNKKVSFIISINRLYSKTDVEVNIISPKIVKYLQIRLRLYEDMRGRLINTVV